MLKTKNNSPPKRKKINKQKKQLINTKTNLNTLNKILIFLLILLAGCTFSVISYVKNNPEKIEYLKTYGPMIIAQNNPNPAWESKHIKSDVDFDKEQYLILKNTLNSVPEPVIDSFYNDGGFFYIIDQYELNKLHENIMSAKYNYSASFVANISGKNQCMIFLSNNKSSLKKDVLHELGHYIDFKTSFSSSETWEKYYKKYYKKTDLKEYYDNPKEFFAQMYMWYISYPELVKIEMPEIYRCMFACEKYIECKNLYQK